MRLREPPARPVEDQLVHHPREGLTGGRVRTGEELVRPRVHRADHRPHLGVVHDVDHPGRHVVEVHLLAVAPDDHVDVRRGPRRHGPQRVFGQHVVADHRQEAAEAEPGVDAVGLAQVAAAHRVAEYLLGGERLVVPDPAHRLRIGRDPQLGGHGGGEPGARPGRAHHLRAAALHDRAAEQPPRQRRAQEAADAHRARRLAEDRDPARVAAERRDVVLHPGERGELVAQPDVARAAAERDEALDAEAVGHRDEHDARARQRRAVVGGRTRLARDERPAVHEHQHRAGPRRRDRASRRRR